MNLLIQNTQKKCCKGHLETLRRHQEKLEKMEIIFKVKQMEKTDPVEAAKYYVAYLQNQKARK